jgi:hypothetical protein
MACRAGCARSGLYRGPWSVFREAESDAGHGRSSVCDVMRITSRLERVEKMQIRDFSGIDAQEFLF